MLPLNNVNSPQHARVNLQESFIVKIKKESYLKALLATLTTTITILAILGGFNSYNPVPFWDMWGSYLNAHEITNSNGVELLLSQHNEHRIILSRILFWIDFKIFEGSVAPLIILNFIFAGLAALVFYTITSHCLPDKEYRHTRFSLNCLSLSLCFVWMQHENFTWGFQSQFFAAQLLPLASLFTLYLSQNPKPNSKIFIIACTLGVASAGTMANGVIALPLMTLFSLAMRSSHRRTMTLAILSSVIITAYFYNFHTPGNHSSLTKSLIQHPIETLHYTLVYIGSPIYYITGQHGAPLIAGITVLAGAIHLSYKSLENKRSDPLVILLLVYILYIGGSAVGTAGGRLIFGIDQALSSRYTTPAIMAWIALLIAYSRQFKQHCNKHLLPQLISLILIASLLPQQITALEKTHNDVHESLVAALAIELKIRDIKQIRFVAPTVDYAFQHADTPIQKNYSIFNDLRIRDTKEEIGAQAPKALLKAPICNGYLDSITTIDGDSNYRAVRGWIYNKSTKSVPSVVKIIDQNGIIIGRALTGGVRPDVQSIISRHATYSGFNGYILSSAPEGKLTIFAFTPESGADGCRFDTPLPN